MAHGPIDTLIRDIEYSMDAGSRPIIWGPAGCGKTRIIEALAKRTGRTLTTIIGSMADPTDVNGFPVVVRDAHATDAGGREHPVVTLAPPELFVNLNRSSRWLLFLDEFSCVPLNIMAPWLRLVQDGKAGQFPLDMSRGAIVIAANPPDEAVNGQELPLPMINRLDHFHFPVTEASALEWAENFVSYWGDTEHGWPKNERPADVTVDHLIRARALVAGFVRRIPTVWHPSISGSKFKREDTMAGWPSGRSLDRAARHLAITLSHNLPPVSCISRVAAAIGSTAALEFQQYITAYDIPDPEAVIADADNWQFSGRVDLDYTVMLAVAAAIGAQPTADRLFAGFKICERSVTNRNGAPVKEAAYAAMSKLAGLAKVGSSAYKTITKGFDAKKCEEFGHNVQKATVWFHKVIDTAKGRK